MPRSTKADTKKVPAKRRIAKRSASEQPRCYDIPESPQSSISATKQVYSKQASEASYASVEHSPTRSNRGRSASTAPSTVIEDTDATPTQTRSSRSTGTSINPKQTPLPGLEALEAVNELYIKLKDSQTELQQLQEEKETLLTLNHELDTKVSMLQSELKAEKDKLKRLNSAQNKEAEMARKDIEQRMKVVLNSLQGFGSAALSIMPLLDVLTGAADIEYDDDTEQLYQIMKQYRTVEENKSGAEVKSENK